MFTVYVFYNDTESSDSGRLFLVGDTGSSVPINPPPAMVFVDASALRCPSKFTFASALDNSLSFSSSGAWEEPFAVVEITFSLLFFSIACGANTGIIGENALGARLSGEVKEDAIRTTSGPVRGASSTSDE